MTAAKDTPPTWAEVPPSRGYHFSNSGFHTLPPVNANHARQVVEVSEWTSRGTAIAIATVTAPRTSMNYKITNGNSPLHGNEEGMFLITPSSGVITLATLLDREKCDFYNLTIVATNPVSKL